MSLPASLQTPNFSSCSQKTTEFFARVTKSGWALQECSINSLSLGTTALVRYGKSLKGKVPWPVLSPMGRSKIAFWGIPSEDWGQAGLSTLEPLQQQLQLWVMPHSQLNAWQQDLKVPVAHSHRHKHSFLATSTFYSNSNYKANTSACFASSRGWGIFCLAQLIPPIIFKQTS